MMTKRRGANQIRYQAMTAQGTLMILNRGLTPGKTSTGALYQSKSGKTMAMKKAKSETCDYYAIFISNTHLHTSLLTTVLLYLMLFL